VTAIPDPYQSEMSIGRHFVGRLLSPTPSDRSDRRCLPQSSSTRCVDVNTRVAAAAGISPDDLMITLYEAPGENFSFGRGEAQRANAVPRNKKRLPLDL
jgi:hypothetical protein